MIIRMLAVCLTLAAATPAFAADVTGRWRTPGNGGEVELVKCGAVLCGKLISSSELKAHPDALDARNKDAAKRGRKLVGLTFLEGFKGGPAEWTGGRIYNPEDGNTYSGTITLQGDTLKLKGCAMAMLCKTQVWTRLR